MLLLGRRLLVYLVREHPPLLLGVHLTGEPRSPVHRERDPLPPVGLAGTLLLPVHLAEEQLPLPRVHMAGEPLLLGEYFPHQSQD